MRQCHTAERLSVYKTTEQSVENPFRDSIVTNLVKLVDMMPRLNVTGDPELERLTKQVRVSLLVDPAELRKSESVRAHTAIKASRTVAQMSAYMGGSTGGFGGSVVTNNTKQTIEQKLSRARVQLLLCQPFFGTLCLRLKLVAAPSFATMATDGRRLVYNPAFVEKLTPAELEGVLAHETMHVALAHHCRRGERDAELRNQATDYPANPILINNGITLPKDALIDPVFADLSAEEIYARLLKHRQDSGKVESPPESSTQPATGGGVGNAPQQAAPDTLQEPQSPEQQPQDSPESPGVSSEPTPTRPGGFGEVLAAVVDDGQPASQAELTRQMYEWAINTEQALCSAKACGHEPGGINTR